MNQEEKVVRLNKKACIPWNTSLPTCLEEISGIEPLTFPAVNAGKPPKAGFD